MFPRQAFFVTDSRVTSYLRQSFRRCLIWIEGEGDVYIDSGNQGSLFVEKRIDSEPNPSPSVLKPIIKGLKPYQNSNWREIVNHNFSSLITGSTSNDIALEGNESGTLHFIDLEAESIVWFSPKSHDQRFQKNQNGTLIIPDGASIKEIADICDYNFSMAITNVTCTNDFVIRIVNQGIWHIFAENLDGIPDNGDGAGGGGGGGSSSSSDGNGSGSGPSSSSSNDAEYMQFASCLTGDAADWWLDISAYQPQVFEINGECFVPSGHTDNPPGALIPWTTVSKYDSCNDCHGCCKTGDCYFHPDSTVSGYQEGISELVSEGERLEFSGLEYVSCGSWKGKGTFKTLGEDGWSDGIEKNVVVTYGSGAFSINGSSLKAENCECESGHYYLEFNDPVDGPHKSTLTVSVDNNDKCAQDEGGSSSSSQAANMPSLTVLASNPANNAICEACENFLGYQDDSKGVKCDAVTSSCGCVRFSQRCPENKWAPSVEAVQAVVTPPKPEPLIVFYPYVRGEFGNRELRYSIRSLENIEGDVEIYVVGDDPGIPGGQFGAINHIHVEKRSGSFCDMFYKAILFAGMRFMQGKQFLWMNDDFYFVNHTPLSYLKHAKASGRYSTSSVSRITENNNGKWQQLRQRSLVKLLETRTRAYDYTGHLPTVYDADKLRELNKTYQFINGQLTPQIIYHNLYPSGKPFADRKQCRVRSEISIGELQSQAEDACVLNHVASQFGGTVEKYLKTRFPHKSRWEG
ncbi:hypothetical protein [Poriferisphaera corsica]|nr:hypothetical protein [Poriferisphaera corsica]